MRFDESFLKETRRVWQPLSAEQLTIADAEEISQAVLGFFEALRRCTEEARAGSDIKTEEIK